MCSGTCHNSPHRSPSHQLVVSNPASTMGYASPTPQWEQVVPRGCSQCAPVQQGQWFSRQRNSIVKVAWVNSLLIYLWSTHFAIQDEYKKKIVTSTIFSFIYTAGISLTTCPSNTFNKQQQERRCCEGFILLLRCPSHLCCSLQSTRVTLAAWPCCSHYFKVIDLHLFGSH